MAGLHFDITGDNSNFMEKLRQTESGIRQTTKKIEDSGIGIEDMFGRLSKAAAGFGAAFSAQQFASQVMKVRGEFQQLEVAFETMLGSAEKASSLMQQLTRTAAITPFGLQDVAGGAKQLLAYGVASEEVNDTLVRLGDIAAGLSIPLNDLVFLYGTTMTQGRMFTQDLRQFQGRGIPLADELAKQFGVTKDKVGELVTAGKVGFEEMNKAIVSMTSAGGKFGGLMEAQSKTITGQISNIEDSIDSMFNEIGKSSEGVINTALGGVSALVENYEKVGEAIGVAVTAYGAYKAAVMTGIALQKAESAITAEAALQKSLAAMAGHTLSASQARGAAMSQLYAIAQTKVVASLKALTAATLANPYVLAAAAITGLVYGVYKLVTADSAAEKATKRLNNAIDEQTKNHDEYKQRIDGLVSSLGNVELSEGTRLANFQALKQEYPEILKDINTENEFLKEKHNILQLINQEQGKQKQNDDIKLLEEAESRLNRLKNEGVYTASYGGSFGGNTTGYRKATKEELDAQQDIVNQLKARVAAPEVDFYLGNIKNLKDSDITTTIEEITIQLQALENAGDNAIGYVTEIGKEFSKSQLKTLKSALEGEQTARGGTKQSGSEWVAQFKKEYDVAQKALIDFMKQKNELSEIEFERQYKDLTDKRDAAKKKYEDAGGSIKSDNKQAEQQAKLSEEILSIQRKNEQDRINLMKDGAEKRIAQINLDWQKEMDAIEKQRNEWKSSQGGKLTDEQHISIGAAIVTAEDTKNTGIAKITEEETKKAEKAMRDYLKEYGSYMEKRQAIIEDYTEKINAATTEGEKLTLGEQMKRELATVDDEASKKTSIITQLFDDMSKKSVEDMRRIADTAEQMLAYINNGEFQEVGDSGKDIFGFTKEQFDVLAKSPEQLESIKNEISNVRNEANEAESTLKKMSNALKNLFGGDSGNFEQDLQTVLNGVSKINQAAEFLGNSLSQISDAFGGNFLGGVAEGVGVATSAVNGAMSGAQAGAVFGPWGAAAGAAIGLVGSLSSSLSKLHDKKHEKAIQRIQEQIETLEKTYDKLGDEINKAYSSDASGLIEDQNKLLEQQKVLIQQQIKEEEAKKKTDNDRIKEWKEQIEEINKTIEDNKEAAVDAIFGNDLKSAIEDFASAYTNAWSAGEDKAKSAKDFVKDMIKNMITESIKAAASDPMKAIRDKLLTFWSDEYISGWEQDYINKMATDLQKDLDEKFGWADSFFDDSSYSQEASSKGFETMSQDTAEELNGRFTALQISNEEIKVQMIQSVALMTQMLSVSSQGNVILNDILVQHAISNGYLEDLVKYSKAMMGFGEKIDKIIENTQNL